MPDSVDELVALFNSFKPEIVINVALPYQDPHSSWKLACKVESIIWILPIMSRKM